MPIYRHQTMKPKENRTKRKLQKKVKSSFVERIIEKENDKNNVLLQCT